MHSLYERVIDGLLIESKTDTISRKLTKNVIQTIIDRIEKINDRKRCICILRNLLPEYEDVFLELRLTVTLREKDVDQVNAAGSWTPAKDELELNIYIDSSDGMFDKRFISSIQNRTYETIRHEIEHSLQSLEQLKSSQIDDDEEEKSPAALWRDTQRLKKYFLSEHEMSAFVAGIYHQAKRTRKPFIDVLNEKLEAYKKVALHYNKDINEVYTLFEEIKITWIAYARKRFPKAIIKA